jgi:hypothetical protein
VRFFQVQQVLTLIATSLKSCRIEPAGGRRIETVPGQLEALVAQWKRISFINTNESNDTYIFEC